MFGWFKKKAVSPAAELSDAELDLIHGGQQVCEVDSAPVRSAEMRNFDAPDAVVAVVGRGDGREGFRRS